MTQEELGAAVGRSRSAVNAWERGRAVPMRSIAPLEDVLAITLRSPDERHPKVPAAIRDAVRRTIAPAAQERVLRAIADTLADQVNDEDPDVALHGGLAAPPCSPGVPGAGDAPLPVPT